MITFKKILCPVDTSECSRAALRHAVALAGWYDAEVTALWVRPASSPPPALWPAYPPAFLAQTDEERVEAEQRLRDFVRETAGTAGDVVCREGAVVPEILRTVTELSPDIIVMGTHGLSGFEHLLLGSVAERVIRKAPCPVLTVPRNASLDQTRTPIFKTILCAIDFSRDSERALQFALSLAQEAAGRLLLVHAVEQFAQPTPLYAGLRDAEFRRRVEVEARQRLAALIPASALSWCDADAVVAEGRAHREVLRIADERRADLIVMGVHGRNALDHALFGSTTNRVLHGARIPVLAVPRIAQAEVAAA